jgi:DNA gyrase inhibitor GyrI
MADLDVRIVTLPPTRVLSFHAFGTEPETQAMAKLQAWGKEHGLLADPSTYRVFGFDNPESSPGSPNRGYEFWLTAGTDVQGDADVPVKEFRGGLYVVTRCPVKDPYQDIPATWKKLVEWCESSPYRMGRHQWLEEHIEVPNEYPLAFTLDLYLPVVK